MIIVLHSCFALRQPRHDGARLSCARTAPVPRRVVAKLLARESHHICGIDGVNDPSLTQACRGGRPPLRLLQRCYNIRCYTPLRLS